MAINISGKGRVQFERMPKTRKKILLVEDLPATRLVLLRSLEHEFEVEAVGDGEDAIGLLRRNDYAMILLDLKLRRVDGYAVLDELREHKPHLLKRVIVFSGLEDPRSKEINPAEVFDVLKKPLQIEALLSVIRRCAASQGA